MIGIANVGENADYDEPPTNGPQSGANEETRKYFKLLEKIEAELYPVCKNFTTLSFIVQLLHMKVLNGWTDKSITMLLQFLFEFLP